MSKIKTIITSIAIVSALLMALVIRNTVTSQDDNKNTTALQRITVGIQTGPANALVMVAKDKNFFEAQGLDVELKQFTAGKFALEAFLGGSLDFSISGDVPVTLAVLQGHTFIIPAQVVRKTINEVRVVARRDGEIDNAYDYFSSKKRKLATSIGGGPEFYTYELLNKLGISKNQIEIISQKPEDMPAALASGSIDAIAIFDPLAFLAEKQLGDNAITFTDQDIYSELYVIEAKESVKENSETLEKLLAGLLVAEDFVSNNPDEAKNIVVKYTKLDKSTVDGIWDNFDFRIALTPQLVEFLNREIAWAKDTGKISKDGLVPDLQSIIWDQPLKNIRPSAVEL